MSNLVITYNIRFPQKNQGRLQTFNGYYDPTMKIIQLKTAGYIEAPPKMSEKIYSIIEKIIELPILSGRIQKNEYIIKTYLSELEYLKENRENAEELNAFKSRKNIINSKSEDIAKIKRQFETFGLTYDNFKINSEITLPIHIDLTGWKYYDLLNTETSKNVLANMSPIVLIIYLGKHKSVRGFWKEEENTLYVAMGMEFDEITSSEAEEGWYKEETKKILSSVKKTIDHELIHMAQTIFEKSGISFGKPSKRLSKPWLTYYFPEAKDGGRDEKLKKVIDRMKDLGMDTDHLSIHSLTDIEFYTNLLNDIQSFRDIASHLSLQERKKIFSIWTGQEPVYIEDVIKGDYNFLNGLLNEDDFKLYRKYGDYEMNVTKMQVLKKNDPQKWKKAIKEFYKGIQDLL